MKMNREVLESYRMCELFAYSSKKPTRARFSLQEFRSHGCDKGPHCDGWGLAFYEKKYAQVYRDENPAAFSKWMDFLLTHEHYSNCVISHIRKATQGGVSLQNTQPFSRECHGARHVFAHNGSLENFKSTCVFDTYEPIGDTDSEYAFCMLMNEMRALWRSSASTPTLQQRTELLSRLFGRWSSFGPANVLYSDGEYLFAFANRRTQSDGERRAPGLHYISRDEREHRQANCLAGLDLDGEVGEITLFASVPLSQEAWQPFAENELIVCQQGKIVAQIVVPNQSESVS